MFVTTLCMSLGFDLESIMRMTNHKADSSAGNQSSMEGYRQSMPRWSSKDVLTVNTRERILEELSDVIHVDDHLLDRLVDAGFSVETIAALPLAPIAFMAWASDRVTDEERQSAVSTIYSANLHGQPAAAALVQTWLDVRPSSELSDLWEDFTRCQLARAPRVLRETLGRHLLEQATKVAMASGGLLGIGAVCKAEGKVLQAIRDVYF